MRTEHEYNALLPWPVIEFPEDLEDTDGEAAAWRQWEVREKAMREREILAAFLAAQQEECRTLPLLHAAQEAVFEEEERQLE